MRHSLVLAGCLLLAACSGLSREARIEAKLEHVGLKPHLARCLAHKLDARLSDDELERLAAAAKAARGDDGHHVSLGRLAGQLQQPGDQHILDVVSTAGLSCTLLG